MSLVAPASDAEVHVEQSHREGTTTKLFCLRATAGAVSLSVAGLFIFLAVDAALLFTYSGKRDEWKSEVKRNMLDLGLGIGDPLASSVRVPSHDYMQSDN